MSLYKGETLIAIGSSYHPNIFDIKWSDHIINDIQWLRADTFSWQSGEVYTTAYNKLVEEYATGTEETEGYVTFKRSTNGFKIADASQESAILSKYNTDGIAWYYILDITNKRFKLPRTKYGFKGVRDKVGNYISESLPNITANWNSAQYDGGWGTPEGAVYGVKNNSPEYNSGSTGMRAYFDASRCSSTYKNGGTVQERGSQMYLYFYVGEFTQTATQQTAGLNSELFNCKLDISSAQAQAPYLKTCYVNGASGYNIWSNGYCEQWGVSYCPEDGTTTINLLKTLKSGEYRQIHVQPIWDTNITGTNSGPTIIAYESGLRSTTQFKVWANSSFISSGVAIYFFWKVSGYLASGQY